MTVIMELWFGWSKLGLRKTLFHKPILEHCLYIFWLFVSRPEIIFISGFSHLTGNHGMHSARDWLHDGFNHFHQKVLSFTTRLWLPTRWWARGPGPRWAWQCRGGMGSDGHRVGRRGLCETNGRLSFVYGKGGWRWPDPDVWSGTGNRPESEHQVRRNGVMTNGRFSCSLKMNINKNSYQVLKLKPKMIVSKNIFLFVLKRD